MEAVSDFIPEKKLLWIDLKGFAEADKTKEAVEEFEASLSSFPFPVSEMTIVINSDSLLTFKPDILPILEYCYTNIYEKFGKCIMVDPENVIAKNQLRRVARSTNFSGQFVGSKQEAWDIIGN